MDLALNDLQSLVCHKTQPTQYYFRKMRIRIQGKKNKPKKPQK